MRRQPIILRGFYPRERFTVISRLIDSQSASSSTVSSYRARFFRLFFPAPVYQLNARFVSGICGLVEQEIYSVETGGNEQLSATSGDCVFIGRRIFLYPRKVAIWFYFLSHIFRVTLYNTLSISLPSNTILFRFPPSNSSRMGSARQLSPRHILVDCDSPEGTFLPTPPTTIHHTTKRRQPFSSARNCYQTPSRKRKQSLVERFMTGLVSQRINPNLVAASVYWDARNVRSFSRHVSGKWGP
nr:uncharacterized protein LOC116433595 isoform X2 [Nomia melanderi]